MSTHKRFDRICVVVLIFSMVLTILFMNGKAFGLEAYVDEDAESYDGDAAFTENDLDGSWNTEGAETIVLQGADGEIKGSGAYFNNGDLVIAKPGRYVVSGELTDGSIVVDAYDTSKIWILLNGVSISCSDDACIRVDQADKVFLTLAEGTKNTLESGSTYSEEALEDGTDGVIFSHDDLTINGSGSLAISGGNKHGIGVNDSLVLAGGSISIEAAADGLHVNDSIDITNTDLTLSVEDDGIHCDGDVLIADGTIQITKCYEGIEGSSIKIQGGDITIYPTDDGMNAAGEVSGSEGGFGMQRGFGGMNMNENEGGEAAAEDVQESGDQGDGSEEAAAEDLKESGEESGEALPNITINGGNITIINQTGADADGIDSNGDIIITGGRILVSLDGSGGNNALDFGTENGGRCLISGGTVIAGGGSSMLEQISGDSDQLSITYMVSETVEAGETVILTDSAGNILLEETMPCSFSAITLSCEEMKLGETYTLKIGEASEEITPEEVAGAYGTGSSGFGGAGGGFGCGFGGGNGGSGGFGNGFSDDFGSENGRFRGESDNGSESGSDNAADSGMPDESGMPDVSGMPDESEMPDESGMPDVSEMPDASGMPDVSGMPQMGGGMRGGMRGGMGQQPQNTDTSSDDTATGKLLSEYGQDTWLQLGASVLILFAGLLFAGLFKRRRP